MTTTPKKVLFAIPEYEYDPSETAIPWKGLSDAGHEITFATPSGKNRGADPIMLTGKGLGLVKKMLMADSNALSAYKEMEKSASFQNPLTYSQIVAKDFDMLVLPGGHAKGVREYIESPILSEIVTHFFDEKKPLGAVCHGVLIPARCVNKKTGKTYLDEYKSTGLLKSQELTAWNLTRLWMGDYYRTYPGTTVEGEVKGLLSSKSNFVSGPTPLFRDTPTNLNAGFVCRDRNYASARWPGDCHKLSKTLCEMLEE